MTTLYECEFCGTVRHPNHTGRTGDGQWYCEGCINLVKRREQVLRYLQQERANEWDESHTVTLLLRILNSLESSAQKREQSLSDESN